MMVSIAIITTVFIQKKLKQKTQLQETDEGYPREFFTHTEMLSFDGLGSQPAYFDRVDS